MSFPVPIPLMFTPLKGLMAVADGLASATAMRPLSGVNISGIGTGKLIEPPSSKTQFQGTRRRPPATAWSWHSSTA